jgi:pyruvate/2-oxoglutarate dehydrogenase complex dihydrolipoamide acyltransferase (E2) component
MGTTMTEGTVVQWLKAEGEPVSEGDDLVEVTTDKVNALIASPSAGVLTRILATPDQTVAVGSVLAYIEPAPTSGD